MAKRMKQTVSLLLALVMVFTMLPITAAAEINETLVNRLTSVYGGDEQRARSDLDLLYDAGIIDEDGNMVALDVREDGASADLDALAQRIAQGDSVGALTVNGTAVSAEQILQIQQIRSLLDTVRLLEQDVEITDQHVANFQKLVAGLADGTIDVDEVIRAGSLSLRAASPRALGAVSDGYETGDMALTDGSFTAPMLSGADYTADYAFSAGAATTWYTDNAHKGIVADGVVTLAVEEKESYAPGDTVTVTASLDKAQTVPVSFDWKVAGAAVGVNGTASGTVTWDAGDTADKTFSFTIGTKADTASLDNATDEEKQTIYADIWQGGRALVINASNIRNAAFTGNAATWSQTIQVAAADNDAIKASYIQTNTVTGFTKVLGRVGQQGTTVTTLYKKLTGDDAWKIPQNGNCTITLRYSKNGPGKLYASLRFAIAAPGNEFNPTANSSNHAKLIEGLSNAWYKNLSESSDPRTINVGNLNSGVVNDKGETLVVVYLYGSTNSAVDAILNEFTIAARKPSEHDLVKSVTVPAGTYHSGEIVPITVELDNFVKADANTKLTVNGVSCGLLDAADTETRKLTFGYTVKTTDTGAVNVTALSGLKNGENMAVTLEAAFAAQSFGVDQDVKLVSDFKSNSIDWDNAKWGVTDTDANDQTVTVVLPIKSGAENIAWITSEQVQYGTGSAVAMPIPGYSDATADYYVPGAYLSTDGGATRYPLFVAMSGGDPVALVARFKAPDNESAGLRKDTLNLFMDPEIVTSENATKYLPALGTAQDAAPYAATAAAAPIVPGQSWTYYLKGGAAFEQDQWTSRGLDDYTGLVANGFLKMGENAYVILQDEANPDHQYDVEIVVNKALRDALLSGVRVEDGQELRLWYQISNRKPFTYIKPEDFTLRSDNTNVAGVSAVESTPGVYNVILTGTLGSSALTLTVGNGAEERAYDLTVGTVEAKAGKTPFLTIPAYSALRTTLTGADTDVLFSSNLTAANAADGNASTAFTATLYAAQTAAEGYEKTGEALWSHPLNSTLDNTITHITVPGSQLTSPGVYALEITAAYAAENKTFTGTAYIEVKNGPAKVTLHKLESYSVTSTAIPAIGYTVTPDDATVEYTVQKSGGEVGERKPASDGAITFSADKPTGLKDSYTVTVYARNEEGDPWSVDSLVLNVYNEDALAIIMADVTAGDIGGTTSGTGEDISGTTVALDNHNKVNTYLNGSDYVLTFQDFETLRTDMSLQKVISANYGEHAWGMLSDRLSWGSSDGSTVSVDYKQGGIYSDIRNYSYTSYVPSTDFLLVGKGATGDDPVTITATHAATGVTKQFTVTAATLENQLYVFQFAPQATTHVVYTNGDGETRDLTSNDKGELAVYEPSGIASTVMALSGSGTETYAGTLYADSLVSGERDIASLQLYPCNNLRLRRISAVELTFLNPDGSRYSGNVTLRAGVYKNGVYCPSAQVRTVNGVEVNQDGRQDVIATVTDGKLSLGFDASQFKHTAEDYGLTQLDTVSYVMEYRVEGNRTGYVRLNAFSDMAGAARATDSLVQLRAVEGLPTTPQITGLHLQQYHENVPNEYVRDVMDYTEDIGISMKFSKAELITEAALTGETVTTDDNGYTTYKPEKSVDFALYTASGKRLSAQTHNTAAQAEQIVDLADLDEATLFVFPFSSTPMARGVYTMTDEVMAADGLSDLGDTYNARVKMMFTRDDLTIRSETMPFGVSNLSHRKDISQEDGGAKEIGSEVRDDMMQQVDIGAIFGSVDVNDMLKKGFAFLTGLGGSAENPFLNMMIMPTEDPATFHIMVFVGDGRDSNAGADGLSVNYNPDDLYDDWSKFEDEMEKLDDDDDSKMKDDDDDDDDDDGGEGKISFSFHGALHLVAKCDVVHNDWDISFRGGQVGAGMKATYEWSQNLMCGPVPVLLSLELGFDVDLDLSFANKDAVRAMLLDAALELSVKAFAGVGFDLSLIEFKLGIEGTITAGLDFLYLTQGNKTGTELGINGKIALIMETKIALISYSTTFASTGFGWTKQYGQYNAIRETWANQGFADITGLTASGRRYAMRLMADGTAMVSIAGEGEMENRDYLLTGERRWNGGTARRGLLRAAPVASFNDVQTNAYPYANPVFTDDGSMFLYISDNDNARNLQSAVHYATRNSSGGYDDAGAVETEAGAIPADSDVTVSGSGSSVFAAWTKQMESPNKEMHDKVNLDDLGIMLNATEIYTGRYDGSAWTVERLTDNQVADLAPTVASTGDKAIVAWRSLSASSLSGSEAREDIAAAFNAENNINYRIYNGTGWTDAQIAYNGAAGTVNALDSAMLPDGTAILTYTVRTGGDAESCETFFTIIGADGNVVTTCRLTQNTTADSNAQAVAVGDAFVLGWYAEDSTGNSSSADGAVSSGHDIRLSRITANGSLDADFPETLGAPTASGSFRFSAPATCTDVAQLSVVWPELLDSQEYDVNAVRFYEDSGAIGVSSPITIAHTGQYYAVDAIDTYTDADGKVYVLALGSDYSADNGSYYDSITSDQIQFVNGEGQSAQSLALTAKQPEASIKLGSAAFPANRIEVEAETNLKELTPGVNLPVRFYVTNTGLAPVTTVKLTLGGESKTVDGLHILPGATVPLTMSYPVPTEKVEDVNYTVTANDAATAGGKLVLNHPDVGIGTMKLLREGDGTRDVQVNLTNITGIPLAGSGKTVKLAFYKDGNCQQSVSETITIPASAYADIDAGIYTYLHTLSVRDFIGEAAEIPESGITVVAKAWVEDPDSAEKYQELYPYDNVASLDFDGLLTKYDTLYSADTAIAENGDETYDVSVKIRNNSLQETDLGTVTADILDSQNKVLASVPLSDSALKLSTEQTRALSLAGVKLTTPGKPASVQFRSTAATVTLDVSVNGGECTEAYVQLTADGKLPDTLPVATNRINTFLGWYTAAEGGEKANPGDQVAPGATLYAQYDYKVGNNVVMSDYQYAKTPATPAMDKATASGITVTYYWTDKEGGFAYNDAVDAGKAWSDGAPVYPGTYYIRAKVSGQGFDPFNTNQTAFHVTDRDPKYEITVEANSDTFTYDNTMKHVTGFKTLTFTFDNVTYTVSGLEAVATGTDAGEYTSAVTGTAVVKDSAGKDLTAQFNVTRLDGKLTVTKADPTAATPTDLTATYGQTLSDVTITNPNGNTPGTWAWVEDGTTAVGNAGERIHKATFTPEDTGNYNTVADVALTVKVNKADPTAATPTNLTATYGQTLADVALTNPEGNTPGTWSWAEDGTTAVGSAGDRFHQAIFTPEDTENYNVVSGVQLTVKVEKAGIEPTVSIDDWTYGEAASEPVLTGNTDNAAVTYTYAAEGSTEFSAAVPTEAGAYTVKATVDATENYNGATLTANFTIAKADIAPQVTLDGWTYGEAAGEPVLTGNSGNAAVAYTYAVKGSDAFGTATPTDAGEYTVKATVDATANYNGGEATADFTIARADLAIADFTYATPTNLTYDGSAKAAIVATGTDIEGAGTVIVKYYSDAQCQNEVDPIDAGTYYVAVTVADGANYNAAKLHDDAWTFTIEKDTPDAAEHFTYATPTDLTYDGNAKSAAVTVKDGINGMGDVTVQYYSDAQRTTPATPTDAGTYYVGITVAEGDNYNATDTDLHDVSWQFTIAKADIHPTVSMKNWTEGYRASEPVLEGNPGEGDVTFTYAKQGKDDFTDKKPTSAGRYIVKATVAETANYNGGEATAQFTIHADESGKLTVDSPLTSVSRVTLNGRVVSPANYIVVGGSVQFTEAFLATLKPGTYTIKVTDGAKTATATYRVAAGGITESVVLSASTGDPGVALYAALAVSSLLGFAWVGKKRKEEE